LVSINLPQPCRAARRRFFAAGIRALPDLINRIPNDACGLERAAMDVTRRRVAILGIAAARAPPLDDAGQNDQASRWSH
jgi:hypothetical protein